MNVNIPGIVDKYQKDPTRLMDILIDIQSSEGFIPDQSIRELADLLKLSKADVEQTISFYHFFTTESRGKYTIYLNNSAVANMYGRQQVAEKLMAETGIKFGEVTRDGLIGLFDTSCIGMNDQEPAAIINGAIFTRLTPFRAKEIVKDIRSGKKVDEMYVASYGDGKNSSASIQSVVSNNIRKKGPILGDDYQPGAGIEKLKTLTPEAVIDEVKRSNIRGRGGAGFPTGLKWEFCRKAPGNPKYIFCNADEGEPGTFKDRVILTEKPKLIFEGMAIAGYAVGAVHGILYVRYEYKYLEKYLRQILDEMRQQQLLGNRIGGIEGFNFEIRIQFGAGSYVCGEESALIESAEGKRGEPRDRPPFPVEKGYLDQPTIVNNVETLCSIVKIILKGGVWYHSMGTSESTGTKLLCISGDCLFPGVYEVEWGFNVNDILEMVGAEPSQAVQVGGPSGSLIGPDQYNRILGYEDLATGGSIIVIGQRRDLLKDIVLNFTDFFIEESCGSCVPCRTLPVLMKQVLEKIIAGKGRKKDLENLKSWGQLMKANRCGLGHTAANPILSSIKNFNQVYKNLLTSDHDYVSDFDLEKSIEASCLAAGRPIKQEDYE